MDRERLDAAKGALRLCFCVDGCEEAGLQLAFKRRDKRDCFSIIHGDTEGRREGQTMSGQDHKGQEPVNPRIVPLPPIVLLLFLAGGYALQQILPIGSGKPATESVIAGNALMVIGFVIAILGAWEMFKARTTIHPGGPAAALVTSGVYRRTRNPMYLSFLFFIIGFGLAMANPWMILLAPILLLYVQERIIKREEGYLTQRFGPEYIAYRNKVRRWF